MKDFPHKVLLTHSSRQARRWCKKEFGLQPTKLIEFQRPHRDAYDLEKGTWYNRVKSNPWAFHFKCPADAIAFKLRWS